MTYPLSPGFESHEHLAFEITDLYVHEPGNATLAPEDDWDTFFPDTAF